jgi:hypothetical protein
MKPTTLLPFLLFALLPLAVEGKFTVFPDTIRGESAELTKIGEGSFRWMFIKLYDGALYLDSENSGTDVLDDVAKRLELQYKVGISADQFRESGDAILKRNVDEATWRAIQDRLAVLNAAYRDVQKGDRYALTYTPEKGTTLSLNGEPLVTVEGEDFARAYFSIWLGEDAAKKSFRDDLLGN